MNILIIPGNWHPQAAGGEFYLSRLIEQLKPYGHNFKGISIQGENHNGIEFVKQGNMERIWIDNNEFIQWADVIFTQLLGSPYAYNKAKQHSKKLVFFAHNTSKGYFLDSNSLVVYNSQTLANMNLFPDNKSFVQQPIIPYAEPKQGSKIALVNCNLNKGAMLFNELAENTPYSFLGIKGGYGEQILSDSVKYVENSPEIDWSDIKLLLVPSETESWSQAASEAIMRGISVIASPLPGIKENLSFAGIYIERNDISLYKQTIKWLMDCPSMYRKQSDICLKRASEYNSSVSLLNEWLINKV